MKKRVVFIHSIASATFSYKPGQTISLDAKLADAWIASGICEDAPDDAASLEAKIADLQAQLAEAKKKK